MVEALKCHNTVFARCCVCRIVHGLSNVVCALLIALCVILILQATQVWEPPNKWEAIYLQLIDA